jgi:carbon monoxide dehydrogenase subunit G
MELEHSFTIPVPPEQAWEVLLDVERVAPCMPGATIDAVDGDVISGRIKVKVGPIALTYAGQARFTEKDEQARVVVLEASGKETRGTGTASATVRSTLQDLGGQTRVTVHTTMNITGRPAQFGRGVMVEVGSKIIEKFAVNLAAQMAAGGPAAQLATDGPAAQLATDGPAAQLATDDKPAAVPAGEAQPVGSSQPGADAMAGRGSTAASGSTAAGEASPGDATLLPIEQLNLPVRSYNSLRREGVHTVGALASRSENDLLAINGLGPQSVKEIKQKLADHGLALDSRVAEPASAAPGNGATVGGVAAGRAAADGARADGATAPGVAAAAAAGPGAAGAAGAATTGTTTQGLNGALPPPAARPPGEDAIDLLSVAGLPVLKRALPVVGILVAALLLLVLRSRRRRRRAANA